jgi:hypothetical protein
MRMNPTGPSSTNLIDLGIEVHILEIFPRFCHGGLIVLVKNVSQDLFLPSLKKARLEHVAS